MIHPLYLWYLHKRLGFILWRLYRQGVRAQRLQRRMKRVMDRIHDHHGLIQ